MIDTDKYEGHTEGPWALSKYTGVGGGARLHTHVKDKRRITDKSTVVFLPRRRLDELTKADTLLIVDAPLLLAEVERLRERLSMWESWFNQGADNKMQDGDIWDIMFHNHECPNGKDCDGGCWNCETKELIG